MANSEWGYNCEDAAYEALSEGGTQLYRFYNAEKGYHFLTTSEEEANNVIVKSIDSRYGVDVVTGQGVEAGDDGWGYTYEGRTFSVSTEKT